MNNKFVFALKPEDKDDFLENVKAVEDGTKKLVIKTKTRLTTLIVMSFLELKEEENQKPKT